jgi:hypothetical protein
VPPHVAPIPHHHSCGSRMKKHSSRAVSQWSRPVAPRAMGEGSATGQTRFSDSSYGK